MNLSIDKKTAVEIFRNMVKIRRFDETVIQLYQVLTGGMDTVSQRGDVWIT